MKNFGKSGFFGHAAGLVWAVVLSAAAVTHARAVVLASYPFTGSSLASTDLDPASTASSIVVGPGLTGSTRFLTADGNPAPAARVGSDETDGTSFTTAVTAGDYVSASLTPGSGSRLVFTSLTFDLSAGPGATSFGTSFPAVLTTNVVLQASINGGTSFINVGNIMGYADTTFTTETFNLASFNSNAALAAGAAVIFRLALYDDANNGNYYTAFDNVTVNGTVTAVPEPGTAAVFALGGLAAGGAAWRRRARGSRK